MGRNSSVGIETGYEPDCPGMESLWRRDFPHMSRPALGPAQPPIEYQIYFSGVKRPGRGVNHPPPSSAEVEEIVELYLYFPLGLHGLF